ncbi:ammonia monooxygenase [Agrobacterium vitis]|uniref:Ammonia monooxygenase n=1 Tax=Agrobacterium vitis TaxID=373 RepID=A0A7J4X363_AGRVI|nr:DUF6527 family protein [Agrobacterium vitis]KAA3526137.1 ammonia monooxygenase [Agrobacterium vitis]MUZ99353.1 ammonia monooxygenase [Agrobacterium vitis]
MSALSSKLRGLSDGRIAFYCPGCHETHQIKVNAAALRGDVIGGPSWSFNGNVDLPTFRPSILVNWSVPSDVPEEFDDENKDQKRVCHSFVTDGRIEFLGDCTHSLAGQTVDLPDWSDGEPT